MKRETLNYGAIISHFFPLSIPKLFCPVDPAGRCKNKSSVRTWGSSITAPDLDLPHSSFYHELSNGVVVDECDQPVRALYKSAVQAGIIRCVSLTSLSNIVESKSREMKTSTRGSSITTNRQVRPEKLNRQQTSDFWPRKMCQNEAGK